MFFKQAGASGKEMSQATLDVVGKMAEACDSLQGFVIFRSFGGGTGSGFGALLSEKLKVPSNKSTLSFSIIPWVKRTPCRENRCWKSP